MLDKVDHLDVVVEVSTTTTRDSTEFRDRFAPKSELSRAWHRASIARTPTFATMRRRVDNTLTCRTTSS